IYDGATGTKLGTFQPYESTVTGTVRVGLADVDGDGRLDIITAVGSGGLPEGRYFDALTFDELDNFNFADMKSKVGGFGAGSYSGPKVNRTRLIHSKNAPRPPVNLNTKGDSHAPAPLAAKFEARPSASPRLPTPPPPGNRAPRGPFRSRRGNCR